MKMSYPIMCLKKDITELLFFLFNSHIRLSTMTNVMINSRMLILFKFITDLNMGQLAMCFGLLKMPKMPELKGKEVSDFIEDPIDTKTIAYK